MNTDDSSAVRYIVLIPVYNDWSAVSALLGLLDAALAAFSRQVEVMIVDDGSTEDLDERAFPGLSFIHIAALRILRLSRNLGHQRAIAVGMAHLEQTRRFEALIVMDGDGEDGPSDIPRLIEEMDRQKGRKIIFASRGKRSEGLVFRIFYRIFKALYTLLTGKRLSFGNFSIVPRSLLQRLVVVAELWNHYPASVLKARLPIGSISVARQPRLQGQSKMNFLSLIMHGLSALSVYGEEVGLRAFMGTFILVLLSSMGMCAVILIRAFTDLAIPGWASYLVAILMAILLQASTLMLFFIFMILHSRNYYSFIPRRDYPYFILKEEVLFSCHD